MPLGVQNGDVQADRAIVWSKTDRPARLIVEWSTNEAFRSPHRVLGPGEIDTTFGPEVTWLSIPAGMKQNRPPSDGLQFFASGRIDGKTGLLTMSIHDLTGKVLHKLDIEPVV